MASKRGPTSELTHDNWDHEEKPEDQGEFKIASEEVLKSRVIKKARRKLTNEDGTGDSGTKNAFIGFSGFSKPPSTAGLKSTGSSPFSFLSKITTNPVLPDNSTETQFKIDSSKTNYIFQSSNTYYSKLKKLNEAVSNWIKTHVDENPICILTPIFKDYEKYLKEIQDNEKTNQSDDKKDLKIDSNIIGSAPIASSTILSTFKFSNEPTTTTTTSNRNKKSAFAIDTNSQTTNTEKPREKPSIFGSTGANIFASSSTGLNFGTIPKLEVSAPITTTGFSFSSSKPFTFGNVAPTTKPSDNGENGTIKEEPEDEDEPPVEEIKLVVEEDSIYSKRCKIFVKSDTDYNDRGIGTLYLKPIKDSDKYQLIVRADTNLGNILVNIILSDAIPVKRMGKNNVMLICIPVPGDIVKPVPTLLRVKTGEEADELLETIMKYRI